jgi:D-amino-acid dehydrogenase
MRVVVVGAGLAGLAVAWYLGKRGADVTVVDAADIGTASWAGAGILQDPPELDDPDLTSLHDHAVLHYRELDAELKELGGPETGFAAVGGLWLDPEPTALETIRERLGRKSIYSSGRFALTLLEPAEVRRRLPVMEHGWYGLASTLTGRVDGRQLGVALRAAARARGARMIQGRARLAIGSSVGVRVGDNLFEADAIVLCAGAWIDDLLEPLGVKLGVVPQRGQVIHLDAGYDTATWPSAILPTGQYLLSFPDGRTVIGTTRELDSGFSAEPTAGGQLAILEELLGAAPGLRNAGIRETRTGLRPFSLDGRPHAGSLGNGVHVLAGLGPSGLKLGPLLAQQLAAQLTEETTLPEFGVLRPRPVPL